jgi:F420-non-reducing hydrogenase iron-sulfur subunit
MEENKKYEPRIIGIFCNWCTYLAADLAGISRMRYSPNMRIARVMCSGRVHPEHVMWAFKQGADGVLIGGCHPGDCHYVEGNHKALRRYTLLKKMLPQFGIEEERLRLEWISGSEADKLKNVVNDFTEKLRELGPMEYEPDDLAPYAEELELEEVSEKKEKTDHDELIIS